MTQESVYKESSNTHRHRLLAGMASLFAASMYHAEVALAVEQDTETFSLEEIVVTARKRAENLQDTPISISAFTARTLEKRQINSANQLSQVTPNLIFDTNAPVSASNSAAQVYIRGVGQSDFQALNDPGVGIYIDGVYYARTIGSVVELLDLEKLEVLRGPQGTLFGRNTIGGAIDIRTKAPDLEENSGYAKITMGSDDRIDAVLVGNLVLNEQLAVRGFFATRNRDGYVTRVAGGPDLGNDNTDHARLRVLWQPSDDITVDISADYNKEDENGGPLVFNRNNPLAAFQRGASFFAGCPGAVFPAPVQPIPNIDDTRCSNSFVQVRNGEFSTEQDFETFSKLETWGVAATVSWDLDWVTVKSITSYRDLASSAARDADGTSLRILHTSSVTEDRQFSQELQFTGTGFDDRLNWVTGLYFFDQHAEDESLILLPEFVGEFILVGPADIQSKAIFAQGTYEVTDNLSLTVGLRYTDEDKMFNPQSRVSSETATFVLADSIVSDDYIALLNSLTPDGTAAPIVINPPTPISIVTLGAGTFLVPTDAVESNASAFTPMVNVSYRLNESLMTYITYSEGFKGGGVNFRETIPNFGSIPFDPESVTQYEIGFKSDWFERRLRVNASAFHTNYNDIQVVVTPQLVPTVINAAAGKVRGFELEVTALPTADLLITAGVGYTDTEYTELSENAQTFGGLTFDSVFQNAPNWSLNVGASYTIDMGDFIVSPRVDWSYRSKRYFNAINTEELAQSGFGLLNLGVSVDYLESWNVTFAVKNVTDKTYRIAGFSTFGASSGYEEAAFSRGREWGLTLKHEF